MSLFSRQSKPPAPESRSGAYSWQQWVNVVTGQSGVSEQSASTIPVAMRASVVYRCVTLVSGTIATFPIHAKRGRVTLDPGPGIVRRPSPSVRRSVWVEQAVASMLLRGGAYGLTDDPSTWRGGYPTRVDLIHPDRVTWDERDGWKLDNEKIEEYPLGPLWQVPLHVIAGSPKGLNPLEYARKTVYAKLVAQEFGSNFFRDGGHPSAILSPETDPGEENAKALKQKFVEATRGNREPIVIPQSIKYSQIQINPEDSQFIDAMRFSDEDLARFFGVSSAMADIVVSGTSLTYSNITDRREDLKQFTLLLPMYRLEEAMAELIPEGVEVKFNPAGLLRGSITERYQTYKLAAEINSMTGDTFMSVGEMRDFEDWDELPEVGAPTSDAATESLTRQLQQIYLAVGTVITADEAREILNRSGAGLVGPMPAPTEPAVDAPARSADVRDVVDAAMRELRSSMSAPAPSVQLHVPESLIARMDIPTPQVTVNVEPTPITVNVDAPVVNVDATPVTVNVDAPVVNVEPTPVTVNVESPGMEYISIDRDAQGRIIGATKVEG